MLVGSVTPTPSRIPRLRISNVRVLLVSRASMSASRAIVGVTLPIYLSTLGYSATQMGEIFAAVAIGSALLSTMVGTYADRFGRKPFLVLFPLLTALAALTCVQTDRTGYVVAACILGSFGRGGGAGGGNVGPYMPAEQALLTASAPETARTKNFGRLAFTSSFGALIGGLIAAATVSGHLTRGDAEAVFRLSFLATGVTAFVAGALGFLLKEPARPKFASSEERKTARGGFFPRNSAGLVYRLWLTNALNGAAIGLFAPFVSYWLFRRYGAS
ncbi:MAG: MFS transporter, partial [Acidimicrobiales bacterium]